MYDFFLFLFTLGFYFIRAPMNLSTQNIPRYVKVSSLIYGKMCVLFSVVVNTDSYNVHVHVE